MYESESKNYAADNDGSLPTLRATPELDNDETSILKEMDSNKLVEEHSKSTVEVFSESNEKSAKRSYARKLTQE